MVTSVEVPMNIGENKIEWVEAAGYQSLKTTIDVTDTGISCISMNDGTCSLFAPEPYVSLIEFTVKGFLAEAAEDVCAWIDESGVANLTLNHALYVYYLSAGWTSLANIKYNVLSPQPSRIEATLATLDTSLGIYYYSAGWTSLGNTKTGCTY